MFKLIKNGTIYAPEEKGAKDILIYGEKIIKIGENISPPKDFACETIDASGKIIYPGFIDNHVHLIGADDGQGPMGRTHDITWKDIVESGTTTLVGCLGSSRFVRSLQSLYIKTLELDMMGLSTYMYTGSFVIPPPTLTGEIRKDVYLIPKVIALKDKPELMVAAKSLIKIKGIICIKGGNEIFGIDCAAKELKTVIITTPGFYVFNGRSASYAAQC